MGSIVASSLQPQLYILLRDSQLCGSVNSAYWTGLVETVFALGSIAGKFLFLRMLVIVSKKLRHF